MKNLVERVKAVNPLKISGKVIQIVGLVVEGYCPNATVGTLCQLLPLGSGEPVPAEVVGFRDSRALLMPLGELRGLGPGSLIQVLRDSASLPVGDHLLGRVLDALGQPSMNVRWHPVSMNVLYIPSRQARWRENLLLILSTWASGQSTVC